MSILKLFTDVFRKDGIVRAGTGVMLVFLAITGWVLFAGSWDGKETAYTHMHCPVCEEEVVYSARMVGSECPNCSNGTGYVPSVGSLRDGTMELSTWAKMIVFLFVALVLVQFLAFLIFQRYKVLHLREEKARNEVLICHCPYCQRKIGFRIAKAGTGGVCPRCKTAFIFTIQEAQNGN